MSYIKFKLVKFEKALAFQILEQDTKILCDHFRFKNIRSDKVPQIDPLDNTIYIRGSNRKQDFKVATQTFISNYERDVRYDEILMEFQRLKEYLDIQSRVHKSSSGNNEGIFEF